MMSWSISWSWQAENRISAIGSVEGGVLVSTGLQLVLIESDGGINGLSKCHSKFIRLRVIME